MAELEGGDPGHLDDQRLVARDLSSGRVLWSAEPPGAPPAAPGVGDHALLVPGLVGGGALAAYDSATGLRRWLTRLPHNPLLAPAAIPGGGGVVLTVDPQVACGD